MKMIQTFLIILFLSYLFYSFHYDSVVIRKVAIIGSGPSGLGLAACLKRLDSKVEVIHVFESRSSISQPSQGGGVQLSGGAVVLDKLGLSKELDRTALPLKHVLSRNIKGETLLEMDLYKEVMNMATSEQEEQQKLIIRFDKNKNNNQHGDSTSSKSPALYTIMRDALQKILIDATLDEKPTTSLNDNKKCNYLSKVQYFPGKRCIGVEEYKTNKIRLLFSNNDNSNDFDDYDMVFGADGVRSSINQYILKERSSWMNYLLNKIFGSSKYRYSGIRITFVITSSSNQLKNRLPRPKQDLNSFHQWFGDGLYVLCGSYGGLDGIYHMLAIVYRDNENQSLGSKNWLNSSSDPNQSPSSNTGTMTIPYLSRKLQESGFQSKDIYKILQSADKERIVDVGLSDRYFPLLHWASKSNRVVLLGDASHPMTPFLGQGSNQALQDAYVLAVGIKKINEMIPDNNSNNNPSYLSTALHDLIMSYEKKRKLFTTRISMIAAILGYIETTESKSGIILRDNLFRILNRTGFAVKSYIDIATPRL